MNPCAACRGRGYAGPLGDTCGACEGSGTEDAFRRETGECRHCGVRLVWVDEKDAGECLPLRGADDTDDADGQWGIGDIILAAKRVETRKANSPLAPPLICAWFDDPAQARSLARFVGAGVRFDVFTNSFEVLFGATRVI